jgi:hypothetical protein
MTSVKVSTIALGAVFYLLLAPLARKAGLAV